MNWGTDRDTVKLDLDREGNWEYSVQVQHEVFRGISASVGWHRRDDYNMWVEDKLAQSYSDYTPFSLTGPVDPRRCPQRPDRPAV